MGVFLNKLQESEREVVRFVARNNQGASDTNSSQKWIDNRTLFPLCAANGDHTRPLPEILVDNGSKAADDVSSQRICSQQVRLILQMGFPGKGAAPQTFAQGADFFSGRRG